MCHIVHRVLLTFLFLSSISLMAQDTTSVKNGMPESKYLKAGKMDARVSIIDLVNADEYFKKGKDLTYWSKYDSANYYLKKASRVYYDLANKNEEDSLWQKYINCLNILGDNYRIADRYKEAMTYLEKALELGLKYFGEDHAAVAASYENIGMVYFYKLMNAEARKYVQKALSIKQKLFGENHLEIAKSYENLGFIEVYAGNRDLSLDYFKRALSLRLQLVGDNHLLTAMSYHSLGRYYYFSSDYDESFKYAEKALILKLRLVGENHLETARSYTDLGHYYHSKGINDKALMYNAKCADMHRKLFGENHHWVAFSYVNMAYIYNDMGEFDKAIEYHIKSIKIIKQLYGENAFLAFNFHYLGDVYSHKGDYRNALINYKKSLKLQIKLGSPIPQQLAFLYRSMGDLFFKQKEFKKALLYLQKALNAIMPYFKDQNIYHNPSIAESYADLFLLYTLAALKAEALNGLYWTTSRNTSDLQASLSTYQLAVKLIDRMRVEYIGESSKLTLGEIAIPTYEKAIKAALSLKGITGNMDYEHLAFVFSEKSRAALLTQNLQEEKAKKFANIPKSLLEKELHFKTMLASYDTDIQKEVLKNDQQDSLKLQDLKSKRFNTFREYETLIHKIERTFPRYYELKYQTETASISDIQSSLDTKTALLEYFFGDSSIYIFAATAGDFDVATIKRDPTFDSKLRALLASFKTITTQSDYLSNASELYEILIKPVEQNISSKQKWIIIPDGQLSLLPFEALLSKPATSEKSIDFNKLNYLINQHGFSYYYSATLYLKSKKIKSAESYAFDFAGFAPVFSKENSKITANESPLFSMQSLKELWAMITRDGKNLDELKYSELEINRIGSMFPENGRQVFVHQAASEENFKNKIKNTKIVHIATHGIIYNQNPKLSNLVFSQPQDSTYEGDDGFLYSEETYNLNMNADLLVLSACQTGTGKLARGEGLIALTRGFLYSGANNIISSFWKVGDENTYQMMVELYRQINSGKSYSSALREAKLKMISNPATAAPQSWASFVLIGK